MIGRSLGADAAPDPNSQVRRNNGIAMFSPSGNAGSHGTRSRVGAGVLVWMLVALVVSASFGVPLWVVAPGAIVLGTLATVALMRAVDASARADVMSAEQFAERLAMARAAEEDRARAFEAIVCAIDSPTIAIDASGVVTLCNPAASKLFGADCSGLSVEEAFTQPDLAAIPIAAMSGATRAGRVRLTRPTGTLLVDVVATPYRAKDRADERHGVVLTLRDVTELASAAQLKTDFVANASHELRTPLASIRAAVETIQDHGADDPETRDRFLTTISKAATRLEALCNDLLDLSRVEATEQSVDLRPVAFAELCEEVAEVFAPVCRERRLAIEVDIDRAARTVRSDQRLLHAIMKNLVENAVKFAYEGTTVRVSARVAPGNGRSGYDGLRIEVADKGIGIPISLQSRVFERFFQADPSRAGSTRGTGLGLAIVKHAARSLGGRVSVDSVWKQGTTMRVEIPEAVQIASDDGAVSAM